MDKPKKFNIPLETLQEAKKCSKGYACLTGEECYLCNVEITKEHHARMLCDKETDCPYRSKLGDKIVCTCPVRHAIYWKYGV